MSMKGQRPDHFLGGNTMKNWQKSACQEIFWIVKGQSRLVKNNRLVPTFGKDCLWSIRLWKKGKNAPSRSTLLSRSIHGQIFPHQVQSESFQGAPPRSNLLDPQRASPPPQSPLRLPPPLQGRAPMVGMHGMSRLVENNGESWFAGNRRRRTRLLQGGEKIQTVWHMQRSYLEAQRTR
jgi:hypothetical protein